MDTELFERLANSQESKDVVTDPTPTPTPSSLSSLYLIQEGDPVGEVASVERFFTIHFSSFIVPAKLLELNNFDDNALHLAALGMDTNCTQENFINYQVGRQQAETTRGFHEKCTSVLIRQYEQKDQEMMRANKGVGTEDQGYQPDAEALSFSELVEVLTDQCLGRTPSPSS